MILLAVIMFFREASSKNHAKTNVDRRKRLLELTLKYAEGKVL